MASYHHLSRTYLSFKDRYSRTSITLHTSSVTLRLPSCQDYRSPTKYKNPDNIFNNASIKSRFLGKGRHGRVPKFSASGDMVEPLEKVKNDQRTTVTWIDLYLPERARPYAYLARLYSQIGSWLTAWPALWSVAFAAEPGQLADLKMLALLTLLCFVTHSMTCTINDYLDREIDAKGERTKLRPLVAGAVTPFQGLCFLGFQVLLGFGIVLPLNDFSRLLWASSLLLHFTYPLIKRVTYWPQAYLGLTLSFAALYGWSAVKGSLDPATLIPLFLSGVCWTIAYDTIYAHQDREDDLKAGVKSTAVLFGDSTKEWITGFGVACIGCLSLTGYNAGVGWLYYAFLAAASSLLTWQIWTVDLANPADCIGKFFSNKWFGAIVFTGILLGRLS